MFLGFTHLGSDIEPRNKIFIEQIQLIAIFTSNSNTTKPVNF